MDACLRDGHNYKVLSTETRGILDKGTWVGEKVRTNFYCTKCLTWSFLEIYYEKDVVYK